MAAIASHLSLGDPACRETVLVSERDVIIPASNGHRDIWCATGLFPGWELYCTLCNAALTANTRAFPLTVFYPVTPSIATFAGRWGRISSLPLKRPEPWVQFFLTREIQTFALTARGGGSFPHATDRRFLPGSSVSPLSREHRGLWLYLRV